MGVKCSSCVDSGAYCLGCYCLCLDMTLGQRALCMIMAWLEGIMHDNGWGEGIMILSQVCFAFWPGSISLGVNPHQYIRDPHWPRAIFWSVRIFFSIFRYLSPTHMPSPEQKIIWFGTAIRSVHTIFDWDGSMAAKLTECRMQDYQCRFNVKKCHSIKIF